MAELNDRARAESRDLNRIRAPGLLVEAILAEELNNAIGLLELESSRAEHLQQEARLPRRWPSAKAPAKTDYFLGRDRDAPLPAIPVKPCTHHIPTEIKSNESDQTSNRAALSYDDAAWEQIRGCSLSAILTTDFARRAADVLRRAPALQRAIAAELDRRAAAKCRRADARTGGAL